ncbi:hypothetical protein [Virgibacillus ainsalahensis]
MKTANLTSRLFSKRLGLQLLAPSKRYVAFDTKTVDCDIKPMVVGVFNTIS